MIFFKTKLFKKWCYLNCLWHYENYSPNFFSAMILKTLVKYQKLLLLGDTLQWWEAFKHEKIKKNKNHKKTKYFFLRWITTKSFREWYYNYFWKNELELNAAILFGVLWSFYWNFQYKKKIFPIKRSVFWPRKMWLKIQIHLLMFQLLLLKNTTILSTWR